MLLRFLSHLFGLDVPWLADDFFGEFLLLIVMFVLFAWVWFGYKGFTHGFKRFLTYVLVLWGVVEFTSVMNWLPFHQLHFLEWNFAVFGTVILVAGTRLKRYQLPVLAVIYLGLSWLITPWA